MDANMYDLDEGVADSLSGAMQGDQIVLPFPALYCWWLNGDQKLKPRVQQPSLADLVPWVGGWASTSPEDFENTCAEIYGENFPGWEVTSLVNSNGETYGAYVNRFLTVAIIGQRERWELSDRNAPDSRKRSHTQILGYAGYRDPERGFMPFGPVVLTAKGLSGKAVKTALGEWNKQTAKVRKETAKNLPAWLFYATIGTFAAEPIVRIVGQGNNQSPITPCQVYVPKDIDGEKLAKVYVGREIALLMSEYRNQADEWLNAWKSGDQASDVPETIESAPAATTPTNAPAQSEKQAPKGKAKGATPPPPDEPPWN